MQLLWTRVSYWLQALVAPSYGVARSFDLQHPLDVCCRTRHICNPALLSACTGLPACLPLSFNRACCCLGCCMIGDVLDLSCSLEGCLVQPGVCQPLDELRDTLDQLPALLTQVRAFQQHVHTNHHSSLEVRNLLCSHA